MTHLAVYGEERQDPKDVMQEKSARFRHCLGLRTQRKGQVKDDAQITVTGRMVVVPTVTEKAEGLVQGKTKSFVLAPLSLNWWLNSHEELSERQAEISIWRQVQHGEIALGVNMEMVL